MVSRDDLLYLLSRLRFPAPRDHDDREGGETCCRSADAPAIL
jgi:hypothetical protein